MSVQRMAESARRHLKSAQKLYDVVHPSEKRGCRAVSGYLFGLAGELAVKQMMFNVGMRPNPSDKRNDPFFAHFPDLRSMLASTAHGRLHGTLARIANSKIFENWTTNMRYCETARIKDSWVDKWKEDATSLVERMDEV